MLQQKRMDALWRLASDIALDDRRLAYEALGLGSSQLVPGQSFAASFARVAGDMLLIEEAHGGRLGDAPHAPGALVRIDVPHAEAVERSHTRHWDAIDGRALLIVPFNAGNALYVVSFCASEAAHRPFTADDDAFAESVAGCIATRIQRKWDAVPERDPLEIVSLN